MNHYLLPSLVLLAVNASAATLITNNGRTTSNVDVPQAFGDNVTVATVDISVSAGVSGTVGTPNIDVGWTSVGGSGGNTNNWQHHIAGGSTPSSGGGALQLDGGGVGSTFSITFTPQNGFGTVLNSFNFINDSGSSVNYSYNINLVDITTSTTVVSTSFNFNPTLQNTVALATVNLNYTGAIGDALRLDLVRVTATGTAGPGNDIYIDNLRFDQVPEPSAAVLGGLGALALLRRRR